MIATPLIEKSGDYFGKDTSQFFRSAPVELSDGVLISNVDFRIKRIEKDSGFMVLEIGGTCVTLKQVRSHYNELAISETPRGQSLDDATSYSTDLPWGQLTFGFTERNLDYLAFIVIGPT